MMTPQLHMDITRQHHAEHVRRAEQARLARQAAAAARDEGADSGAAQRFRRLVARRAPAPKLEPRVTGGAA